MILSAFIFQPLIKLLHPFRAFSQNLEGMLRTGGHDSVNRRYLLERIILMEKITHGANKYFASLFPSQRLIKPVRVESRFKWVVCGVSVHPLKSVCQWFGVAIITTRTCFCATRKRVPAFVCPFDFSFAHLTP